VKTKVRDHPRREDERVLMMLHLREVEGLQWAEISERYGNPKTYANVTCNRVLRDLAESEGPVPVVQAKPENRDGSQGPLWWRKRAVGPAPAKAGVR
jgi:hypothetical protein